MTLLDLKQELSSRLGQPVSDVLTREGESVGEMIDLYRPSPAGFGGRRVTQAGRQFAWELWLEDEETWNFHASPLG